MGASLITSLVITLASGLTGEFVKVGDLGNKPARNGKGSVEYEYEISVGELNNHDYALFLNSVASESDAYGLYSPTMSQHFFGGIVRETNEDGTYKYVVKPGYDLLPVSGISWISAARYCNWLHYNAEFIDSGTPIDEFYPFTEGDESRGAYNTKVNDLTTITRNKGAIYWIPNRDEWYKAGYYNGTKWDEDLVYANANVYNPQKGWGVEYPHLRSSDKDSVYSHYGTIAQQGNVAEWVEDRSGDTRMAMGGSAIRPIDFARFDRNEGDYADKGVISFGVRIGREVARDKLVQSNNINDIAKLQTVSQLVESSATVVFKTDGNGAQYVKVGNSGNIGDIVNKFKGAVGYEYGIMRYELSNSEYCRFLNAVASIRDTYGLYDTAMGYGVTGGIIREKDADGFKYIVREGYEKKPVSYIGFYELARYANWLHYGCPIGEQVIGVTEGDKEQGAYDTTDFEAIRTGKKKAYREFGQRNVGAMYWIPNENEWYKAAYYDPSIFGHRKYHDYPTRTSMPPTSSEANYMIDNKLTVGEPYFVADVDSFADSHSFYGTLNQGGNVWEWTESWQYGIVGQRALRGGSWQYTQQGLNAENEDPGGINDKSYLFGGRLCCAVDNTGYKPVGLSFTQKTYQWILMRPQKHLLFGFFILLILGAFGVYKIVYPLSITSYKWISKKLKQK